MKRALLILVVPSLAAFAAAYGELPLAFEANLGQTDPQVRFVTRGNGMTMFLTDSEAVTVLGRGAATVRMKIAGGRAPRQVRGLDRLPGITNYFLGNDPSGWRTNILSYGKVVFEGVYPHIDLVYRGNQRRLEYDFVVAPGGNADAIELAYEGVNRVQVEPEGDLLLETAAGTLRQARPLIYQETGGRRVPIAGGYKVQGRRVGFELARYDASRPLIIDPVLEYSTFLGGTGQDQGNAIAVDSEGCAYVTGFTTSANFPVQTPYKGRQTGQDVFVTKLRPDGSALMFSTYIGGSGDEAGAGIAVDSTGSAYIAGTTTSANFPTQSPFQNTKHGFSDAFVVKLSPAGNTLVYATYIGGTGSQEGHAIALDTKGSAYITGWTSSTDYPAQSPIQSWKGVSDAFVTKLTPDGKGLVYSTFLGGGLTDQGNGIAVDAAGSAYVTGSTESSDFPTRVPYLTYQALTDAFVAKLTPAGDALLYSTYLGGAGNEVGRAVAVDQAGSAYVTGWTDSSNFPTQGPYQKNRGGYDVFVTKLAPDGTRLAYSTYLGGTADDIGNGIAVDTAGSAYVTGWTASSNFPTAYAWQSTWGSQDDVFVAKLKPAGDSIEYATYLGGTLEDGGSAIAVDGKFAAYVTGWAFSPPFPVMRPYQATYSGAGDAFVTKIQGRARLSRTRP